MFHFQLVAEQKNFTRSLDEFCNTLCFVFIGEGQIQDYYGSKPMSVTWELGEPLPNYLWKAAAKLRVG